MYEGILSTIGHTPLVHLTRILPRVAFDVYAKLEIFNPGGSIKDRTAFYIIKRALEEGIIGPGTTVVESSSGNMGIGMAQACAYFQLPFICVIDTKTTKQNINILLAYGAEIDLVSEPDPDSGEYLPARIRRVQSLLRAIPDSFWPDQYSNLNNARAHHLTMKEIVSDAGGKVDYLFCTTSTCGTIRGCAEYIREHQLETKVVAVDAVGSIIFGAPPARRLIPGHGAAQIPKLHRPELVDECLHVSDEECIVGCRRLVHREAILVGGSSGGVLMALDRIKETIPAGATCVLIFPDRGERYLDTIYNDEWVNKHFGDISHRWQDGKRVVERLVEKL